MTDMEISCGGSVDKQQNIVPRYSHTAQTAFVGTAVQLVDGGLVDGTVRLYGGKRVTLAGFTREGEAAACSSSILKSRRAVVGRGKAYAQIEKDIVGQSGAELPVPARWMPNASCFSCELGEPCRATDNTGGSSSERWLTSKPVSGDLKRGPVSTGHPAIAGGPSALTQS